MSSVSLCSIRQIIILNVQVTVVGKRVEHGAWAAGVVSARSNPRLESLANRGEGQN